MQSTTQTADMLALWAAEELWDWRVRLLFGIVCIVFALATLGVYLLWARRDPEDQLGRPRRYMGRLSASLAVIATAEAGFFKEPVSTVLLFGCALAIALIGLSMPKGSPAATSEEIAQQEETQV